MARGASGGFPMGVIVILLLASLVMGTTFLVLFVRAVRSGQYEDTVTPAMRVLADDEPGGGSSDWKKTKCDLPVTGK